MDAESSDDDGKDSGGADTNQDSDLMVSSAPEACKSTQSKTSGSLQNCLVYLDGTNQEHVSKDYTSNRMSSSRCNNV